MCSRQHRRGKFGHGPQQAKSRTVSQAISTLMSCHSPSVPEPKSCAKPKHASQRCQQCIEIFSREQVHASPSHPVPTPRKCSRAVPATPLHACHASLHRCFVICSKALCDAACNASHRCLRRVRRKHAQAHRRYARAVLSCACRPISSTTKNFRDFRVAQADLRKHVHACLRSRSIDTKQIGRPPAADRGSVVDAPGQCSSSATSAA